MPSTAEPADSSASAGPVKLILASASPRRRELIANLRVPFEVVSSRFEEPPPPAEPGSIPSLVEKLAAGKALEVAGRHPAAFVLGADTLVSLSIDGYGIALGKPKDRLDAARMLRSLSGRSHAVYTGIALVSPAGFPLQRLVTETVCTVVEFRELSDRMIQEYISTGEPMDKAGAYGAQGFGAPFITSLNGDYFNVVGLPLCAIGRLLENAGLEWWRAGE